MKQSLTWRYQVVEVIKHKLIRNPVGNSNLKAKTTIINCVTLVPGDKQTLNPQKVEKYMEYRVEQMWNFYIV